MPRTQVPGSQITDNTITTDDIKDFTVQKRDIDILTEGQALITDLTSFSGSVVIIGTGTDFGTGSVDLHVDIQNVAGSAARIDAITDIGVPGFGVKYLEHGSGIPHTAVPVVLGEEWIIKSATIAVDAADATQAYDLKLYKDPETASPTLIATLLTLTATSTTASDDTIVVPVVAGNYGLALERVGAGGKSDFKAVVAQIFLVKPVNTIQTPRPASAYAGTTAPTVEIT